LEEIPEGETNAMTERRTLDVRTLYGGTAKLAELEAYLQKAKEVAGEGNEVILTGQGPIWLYLKVAHALHGEARKLIYRAPALKQGDVQFDVTVFDHDAF
jgi:hypothetical protein